MKRRRRPRLDNERFWDLSSYSLRYIIRDAGEAIKANPECSQAGKWADQVNDASTVLYTRNRRKEARN